MSEGRGKNDLYAACAIILALIALFLLGAEERLGDFSLQIVLFSGGALGGFATTLASKQGEIETPKETETGYDLGYIADILTGSIGSYIAYFLFTPYIKWENIVGASHTVTVPAAISALVFGTVGSSLILHVKTSLENAALRGKVATTREKINELSVTVSELSSLAKGGKEEYRLLSAPEVREHIDKLAKTIEELKEELEL